MDDMKQEEKTRSVKVHSAAIIGLDGIPIEVEVDSTAGLHFFSIVGLPDKTVEESKDRIGSAIRNSGLIAPSQKNRRIIVNLAPAHIKKEGSAFDLPIALGYLLTTNQISFETAGRIFLGELSLDGSLRPLKGILPLAIAAAEQGFTEIIIPSENCLEASVVENIRITGVRNLKELIPYLQGQAEIAPTPLFQYTTSDTSLSDVANNYVDLDQIQGQEAAKRALLISACGGHNLLLYGPPGSGKSMLAQALPGILPPMSYQEALEVSKIYSISGLLKNSPLISQRPFRKPHHTASLIALIGGGSWPKPGEISLAHRGVLFLDELPEYPRNAIEALRQPLESGEIIISRSATSLRFPARFMLVAAMNPCPCGNYGNPRTACTCNPGTIQRYQRKISGPLLDRLDIQVKVPHENYKNLSSTSAKESKSSVRELVIKVRQLQASRSRNAILTNADLTPAHIKEFCLLSKSAERLIANAMDLYGISGRGYHKILKIGRTIADIEDREVIEEHHIAEAISYRVRQKDTGLM